MTTQTYAGDVRHVTTMALKPGDVLNAWEVALPGDTSAPSEIVMSVEALPGDNYAVAVTSIKYARNGEILTRYAGKEAIHDILRQSWRTEMLDLADYIEKMDRFNMGTFGSYLEEDGTIEEAMPWTVTPLTLVGECNTVACLCGWQNARKGRYLADMKSAGQDLGLTEREWMELFTPSIMDDDRKTVWGDIDPDKATAADGARVLREIAFGLRSFILDPRYYY